MEKQRITAMVWTIVAGIAGFGARMQAPMLSKSSFCKSGGLLLLLALSGCGGSTMLKEPEPLVVAKPLAKAADQHLAATLDWVIYRDGPGTWAENVDWDGYLIRIKNLGDKPVRVADIIVLDSLGVWVESRSSLRELTTGTRQAKRRYNGAGLEVKAGAGDAFAVTAGAMSVGALIGAATASSPYYAPASGAAVGAMSFGLVAIPFLAVGGVDRMLRESEVKEELVARRTSLPILLQPQEERNLHLFFPLTPGPRQLEITYTDAQGFHTVSVDTGTALERLHLGQAAASETGSAAAAGSGH